MHEGAVEAVQQRRMHSAVDAMTAAAAVLAKQRLALFGERLVDALLPEPACVGGRIHDCYLPSHVRMLHAAELGAFDLIRAGLGRFEPYRFESAGHDVVFYTKGGDEEAVDHVL